MRIASAAESPAAKKFMWQKGCLMTKLTLILTLTDPHDAEPYPY